MAKKKSLTEAVNSEIQSKFNLEAFKTKKGLEGNSKYKDQEWIEFSPALQEALSLKGIPKGHLSLTRGRSDTGKTTLLLEVASQAQKDGVLPVFIITEMKWDFEHAIKMGFQAERVVDPEDPTNINYTGFFLYADRTTLDTIEDVAAFIIDILDEQKKGNLPYDLLFLWDSSGSIPCRMSVDAKSNNPQWNAGAMATQFGNFVNQKFPMSRKVESPYTNTMLVINKVGVQPAATIFSQPKMTNKGGDALYWDASLVITFGNVTNSGTSKIKATKNKKNVEFAKRTKVSIDKLHLGEGLSTQATIIVTPHGFIKDDPNELNKYKKKYSNDWFEGNSKGEIEISEDLSEWDEFKNTSTLLNDEEEN